MSRFDRRAFGWDTRFAEFLIFAPVSSVAAFAAVIGLDTARRLDPNQGMTAGFFFFVGGLWVMAFHYLVATLPSFVIWGTVTRLARACGFSEDGAMRFAAPGTALAASLLLLVWLRDEDYQRMVPAITIVSMVASVVVAERIIRSNAARGAP